MFDDSLGYKVKFELKKVKMNCRRISGSAILRVCCSGYKSPVRFPAFTLCFTTVYTQLCLVPGHLRPSLPSWVPGIHVIHI